MRNKSLVSVMSFLVALSVRVLAAQEIPQQQESLSPQQMAVVGEMKQLQRKLLVAEALVETLDENEKATPARKKRAEKAVELWEKKIGKLYEKYPDLRTWMILAVRPAPSELIYFPQGVLPPNQIDPRTGKVGPIWLTVQTDKVRTEIGPNRVQNVTLGQTRWYYIVGYPGAFLGINGDGPRGLGSQTGPYPQLADTPIYGVPGYEAPVQNFFLPQVGEAAYSNMLHFFTTEAEWKKFQEAEAKKTPKQKLKELKKLQTLLEKLIEAQGWDTEYVPFLDQVKDEVEVLEEEIKAEKEAAKAEAEAAKAAKKEALKAKKAKANPEAEAEAEPETKEEK